MRAWCRYTRRRFESTHGGFFCVPSRATHHTTQHNTQHNTQYNTHTPHTPHTPHTHKAYDSSTRFLLCVTVMFQNPADGFRADRALGSSGSAKRRRERRLRAMLRHERQTVAMALAEKLHHSSRGQRMARAGEEESETNYTAALRKMLPPRDGFCGTLWDICPRLLLMSLCRRWWTSCWTLSISSPHSRLILSRLSKCPRSCTSMSLCARPCALRSWWNSWWKYRRPCLTLRYSGLWNSSSTFQFPGSELPSRKRISERIVEQIVDPVSRGSLPGSSSSHSPAGDEERADELGTGVFRTFPQLKKVRRSLRTRGRNCLRTPAHGRRRLSGRRWTSCSLSRYSSGRRRSGPGFLSSSAPLPRRGGGRGRRGGRGVFLAPPLGFRGAENCGVSAVAVLQHCCRLLLSCRKRRSIWSSLFSRPQSFLSCCTFQAGFAGYNTPRAVFSFLVRRPMKLCIMAGMVQKDSYALFPGKAGIACDNLALCSLPWFTSS